MNIKRLTLKEKPAARKLWRDVFIDDTDAFVDFYFNEEFDRDIYFGIFDDEKLVSMVGLTSVSIRLNGMDKSTFLFRGVATDAAYIGKGYASQLMTHAMAYLKSLGTPFVLLKTFIHSFYEKLGFATCAYTHNEIIAPKPLGVGVTYEIWHSVQDIDATVLEKLYKLYISFVAEKNLFIVRTKENFYKKLYEAMDVSKEELIILFERDRPISYSLCEMHANGVYGEETIFADKEHLHFYAQIAADKSGDIFVHKNVMSGQNADAMCRVLNIEVMLKQLTLTKTTFIQIEDILFADNDGVWKVAITDGKKDVSKVEKPDDITEPIAFSISVGALGAYLVGEEAPQDITTYFKKSSPHGIFEQY